MRIASSESVSSLLGPSGEISLLFFAATGFAAFANQKIRDALVEHGLADSSMKDTIEVIKTLEKPSSDSDDNEVECQVDALRWCINSVLGWQQIDRRIDE